MRGGREAVDGKPLDGCVERAEATVRRVDMDVGAAVTFGARQVGGERSTGRLARLLNDGAWCGKSMSSWRRYWSRGGKVLVEGAMGPKQS